LKDYENHPYFLTVEDATIPNKVIGTLEAVDHSKIKQPNKEDYKNLNPSFYKIDSINY
jgi:hypothetical protein